MRGALRARQQPEKTVGVAFKVGRTGVAVSSGSWRVIATSVSSYVSSTSIMV
jgi:hypothetical protein